MYKIAVLNYNSAGIGKFRLIDPHIALQQIAPSDFNVSFIEDKDIFNDSILNYDLIITHFSIVQQQDRVNKLYEIRSKKPTLKIVIDVDDYWTVNPTSPLYRKIIEDKIPQKTINLFKQADLIVCATQVLVDEINKSCLTPTILLKNGILPSDQQFIPRLKESSKLRIGWVGGSSHIDDIKMLRQVAPMIISKYDNVQFVLCGFNPMIRDIHTKQVIIDPLKTVWSDYEKIFTDDYRIIKDEMYKKYLLSFDKKEFENIDAQPYRRIWTLPVNNYGTAYNYIDICLAPLQNTKFNNAKSALKFIEAGFHKKPIIVSDVEPYAEIVDGYNGIKVKESKGPKDWVKAISNVIENTELQNSLAENLHTFVKQNYDAKNIAIERAKIYLEILKK